MVNMLQLGDIIRIESPQRNDLHESTCYIHYYDPNDFMELVNVSSLKSVSIPLKYGRWSSESQIQKILLLNRSIHKGFARQNGLLPNTWVDLEFSGDIRSVIIAQITHLEEDMIELTTFPERDVLYIDFAYKGIPKQIPLKHLCICHPPASYEAVIESDHKDKPPTEIDESIELTEEEQVKTEYNPQGELIIDTPDKVILEENYTDKLHTEYVQHSQESRDLVSVDTYTEQIESVYYTIDAQMNFLLDDFLSTIPDEKRTQQVIRDIYIHLNRFKELRELYSRKDEFGQIKGFITHDPKHYKPLVESLYSLSDVPRWIIPVANVKQHLYLDEMDGVEPTTDTHIIEIDEAIVQEQDTIQKLFSDHSSVQPNDGIEQQDYPNKYETLYQTLNKGFYTPHSILTDSILEPLARELAIIKDVDMILGTNQSYVSTSVMYDKANPVFLRKPYKLRRFQGSIPYSHFLNKHTHHLKTLMNADTVNLESFLFLPEQYVENTQYKYGNILEQTKQHVPYLSSVLHDSSSIRHDIDLATSERNNDIDAIFPYESALAQVAMVPNENAIHDAQLKYPTYRAFLQSILPTVSSLIQKHYAKNANKYNLLHYLNSFSPYGVFKEHISFSTYQTIKKHLIQNVQNYGTDLLEMREKFVQYALAKFNIKGADSNPLYFPPVDKYFMENAAQKKTFHKNHMLESIPEYEQFKQIMDVNNGSVFFAWLLLLNMDLITPVNMIEPFADPTHLQKIPKKVLAKKYTSLREMQEDNDKRDLKYDTEYDANQYDFIQKYRKEMSTYTPEQFLDFLADSLSSEYGCSLDQVRTLAEELVQGFKLVQENDYALLELKPHLPEGVEEIQLSNKEKGNVEIEANARKVQKYFKRVNHVWIYDSDVDNESFAKPAELTCALNADKLDTNEVQRIFKNQYGETMDAIQKNIQDLVHKSQLRMEQFLTLRQQKLFEHDKQMTKLGNLAYISESLPSKHQALLDNILHKSNSFEERQFNIVSFANLHCRDALPNESSGWKYCNESETSLKLLPVALYELAVAFENNQYVAMLSSLVKNKQIKYEDGRYVLVHGGYILDFMEFSDQGMEMAIELDEQDTWDHTNSELDTNYDVILSSSGDKKRYGSSKLRLLYNVIHALAKITHVPMDRIEDTAMSLCMDLLSRKDIYVGEKRYEEQMMQKHKDKKKYPSYETYENSKMLDMATCTFTIALQSLIPSYEPRKSVGNCTKILDGFPLNQDSGEEGTLHYIACVLRKMQGDKKTLPYSTISKTDGAMETRLKKMFDICLKEDKVLHLLREKRTHLEKKADSIPQAVQIKSSWPHFLPPLKSTHILKGKVPLRNIEKAAHDMLKKTLKAGDHRQWQYLGMYFAKILSFSFGFQDVVNDIVREKGSLLEKYGQIPWLENACCNELKTSSHPISYFAKEDERIAEYIKTTHTLGALLQKTRIYVQSPFLHMEKPDAPVIISNAISLEPAQLSENMMYRTFIHYTGLDSHTRPIPTHLEAFIKEKYEEYNPKGAIEEKIAFLKDNNHTLNVQSFQSFMTSSHRENRIAYTPNIQRSYHDIVSDTLVQFQNHFSKSAKIQEFSEHFKQYMNRDHIGNMDEMMDSEENMEGGDDDKKVNPEQLREEMLEHLENFFVLTIDHMKEKIQTVFRNLGIKRNTLENFLERISFSHIEKIHYTELGSFIKNYLYYICVLVPQYLKTGAKMDSMTTKTFLMKHDVQKINTALESKYRYLNEFVNDDILCPLMETALPGLSKLYKLLSQYPGFFPTTKTSLYNRYFLFSLWFVFYYLVEITENETALNVIFKHIQQVERKELEENGGDTILDADSDEDVDVIELRAADKATVQTKLWKFLKQLLQSREMFHRDKTELLLPYEEIRRNVIRLEEAEKIKMMNRFKQIAEHKTRKAEKDLKKYHLDKYYVNQDAINTYGKRRDQMLNTDDLNEKDILFRDEQEFLEDNDDTENISDNRDFIYGQEENETIDWGDDEEDDVHFLQHNHEDDDHYDIAENAMDRL